MISSIRQKLAEIGKTNCESQVLVAQEKGRGVKLTTSSNGKALKIKVDDYLIKDTQRCDCLYFYQQSKSKRHAFLVELKGNNYTHALDQLETTKNHPNYVGIITVAKPLKEWAVAIVSEKAKTNRPKKEEWEDANRVRLRVIPVKDDEIFDLSELTKPI